MLNTFQHSVGIDVSKDTLDFIGRAADGQYPDQMTSHIENESKSIRKHLKNFNLTETLFIVEPTGTYSDKILNELGRIEANVKIANPLASRRYAQVRGVTNINDQVSARLLADMGAQLADNLPDYQPLSPEMKKRKELLTALAAADKTLQADKNRLHALEQMEAPTKLCVQVCKDRIALCQTQIEELNAVLLDMDKDETYQKIYDLATSVKGISTVTGTWLIVITGGFQNFVNAKQVLKFLGLAPTSHRSGSSVYRKGRITKNGNNMVRGKLYMAALSAIQWNHACKELYVRLRAKGKGHYCAITAAMCKLVKQAFAVVKSGIAFDNDYYTKFKKK